MGEQPVLGDFHLLTRNGFVLLRDLPAKWVRAVTQGRRRVDGWYDMRTKSGRAGAHACAVIERWARRTTRGKWG